MPAARLRAQENKVEAQWQADRKLARQLANEERSEKKKVERAEAQARSPSKPAAGGYIRAGRSNFRAM